MRSSRLAPTLLVALLVASGCGSSGTPDSIPGTTPTPATLQMDSPEGTMDVTLRGSDPTARHSLSATPEAVWAALPAVYKELEVPVSSIVTSQKRLGNPAFNVRRQLAGQRLSRYLECGQRLGERNADSYDVMMRVETLVRPADAGGTVLTTAVEGSARPLGVSGNPVRCTSTGYLEERMLELIRKQVEK